MGLSNRQHVAEQDIHQISSTQQGYPGHAKKPKTVVSSVMASPVPLISLSVNWHSNPLLLLTTRTSL
jgi:hypothetical protein